MSGRLAPTEGFDSALSSPGTQVRPAAQRLRTAAAFARDVDATRRAFDNWLAVGAVAGAVLPGRIPPRGGLPRLMERRMSFRTRAGPTLTTDLGSAWPIVEIFRDGHYDVPIAWNEVERVVDVGGHVGAFAIWVATRAPNALIETFEPEPRNFADLVANVERNGLGDRIVAHNVAAGVRDERAVLHVPSQRDMSSLTAGAGRPIEVECVSLDRHLRKHVDGTVDVVKLDCEGAEWEILPSLSDATLRRVRHLLVEFHGDGRERIDTMLQTLAARGFATSVIATGVGKVPFPFLATIWGAAS